MNRAEKERMALTLERERRRERMKMEVAAKRALEKMMRQQAYAAFQKKHEIAGDCIEIGSEEEKEQMNIEPPTPTTLPPALRDSLLTVEDYYPEVSSTIAQSNTNTADTIPARTGIVSQMQQRMLGIYGQQNLVNAPLLKECLIAPSSFDVPPYAPFLHSLSPILPPLRQKQAKEKALKRGFDHKSKQKEKRRNETQHNDDSNKYSLVGDSTSISGYSNDEKEKELEKLESLNLISIRKALPSDGVHLPILTSDSESDRSSNASSRRHTPLSRGYTHIKDPRHYFAATDNEVSDQSVTSDSDITTAMEKGKHWAAFPKLETKQRSGFVSSIGIRRSKKK